MKGFLALESAVNVGDDFGGNDADALLGVLLLGVLLLGVVTEVLEGVTKMAFCRRVQINHLAVRVANRDAVRRGFHRPLDEREPLGVAPHFGDVGGDAQHLYRAVFTQQRRFHGGVHNHLTIGTGEFLLEGHRLALSQHDAVVLEPLGEFGSVVGMTGTDARPEIGDVGVVDLEQPGVDQHQLALGVTHKDGIGRGVEHLLEQAFFALEPHLGQLAGSDILNKSLIVKRAPRIVSHRPSTLGDPASLGAVVRNDLGFQRVHPALTCQQGIKLFALTRQHVPLFAAQSNLLQKLCLAVAVVGADQRWIGPDHHAVGSGLIDALGGVLEEAAVHGKRFFALEFGQLAGGDVLNGALDVEPLTRRVAHQSGTLGNPAAFPAQGKLYLRLETHQSGLGLEQNHELGKTLGLNVPASRIFTHRLAQFVLARAAVEAQQRRISPQQLACCVQSVDALGGVLEQTLEQRQRFFTLELGLLLLAKVERVPDKHLDFTPCRQHRLEATQKVAFALLGIHRFLALDPHLGFPNLLDTFSPVFEHILTAPHRARHLFPGNTLKTAAQLGVGNHGRVEIHNSFVAVEQNQLERQMVQNLGVQAAQGFALPRVLERSQQIVGAKHHASQPLGSIEQRGQGKAQQRHRAVGAKTGQLERTHLSSAARLRKGHVQAGAAQRWNALEELTRHLHGAKAKQGQRRRIEAPHPALEVGGKRGLG